MANTFSAVVGSIFAKAQLALRGYTVMPRLVRTDWSAEAAQHGDTINVPLPPELTAEDVSPSSTPEAQDNHTRRTVAIPLSRWRRVGITLTDKEAAEIVEGARSEDLNAAMATLAEDVNSYVLDTAYKGIYGYVGTAGTTPFATDLSELIAARKTMFDQKAPKGERSLVLSGAAEANFLNLRPIQDFKGSETLVSGEIGRVLGFDVFADQEVPTHTLVGDDCALDDTVARAVGLKTLHMDGLSTAPAAGDVFTIAGDSQTYVVTSSTTLVGSDSDVSFEPGLKVAIPAADGNEVVTFKASHVVNLAFSKNCIALASRPLAPADGFTGGNIVRSMMDPETGLGMTLEISRQNHQNLWEFSILCGAKCIRPEYGVRIAG